MPDGEVSLDAEIVGRLVAAQFPQLADLPITAVQSTGTVNAIYRIGDHLCARLQRLETWGSARSSTSVAPGSVTRPQT